MIIRILIFIVSILAASVFWVSCSDGSNVTLEQKQHCDSIANESTVVATDSNATQASVILDGVRKLVAAYQAMGIRYDDNHIMIHGEKIVYDDKKEKHFIFHRTLDNVVFLLIL